MAVIADEWNDIVATCHKLGKQQGVKLPEALSALQGDPYRRQSQRLAALNVFLKSLEKSLTPKSATKAKAKAKDAG